MFVFCRKRFREIPDDIRFAVMFRFLRENNPIRVVEAFAVAVKVFVFFFLGKIGSHIGSGLCHLWVNIKIYIFFFY